MDGMLSWLAGVGTTAFRWSALTFIVMNGVAISAFVLTRDRSLVNRWTGRLLAANLALAATGLGIPMLTTLTRAAIAAVMPSTRTSLMPARDKRETIAAPERVELTPRP